MADGYTYDDGGRAAAGYQGSTGDCAVRAIAIAMDEDYHAVYDELARSMRARPTRKAGGRAPRSPRSGTPMAVIHDFMARRGWEWTPTMQIGSGCRVHLRPDELPSGRLVVRLTRHVCAVIDGVVRDTHDPSRGGSRCVYGYWAPTTIPVGRIEDV